MVPFIWSVSCYEYLKPCLMDCHIVFGSSSFIFSSVSLMLFMLSRFDCSKRANSSGEYCEFGS